jgi:DtxR family Mn-dependent transcriptional regulator
MSVLDLSTRTQQYLKVIWGMQEWSDAPVTTTLLAEKIGVRPPTVSDALRKLSDEGLVHHVRYGAVQLTADGSSLALEMVRRHRLIETYLAEHLGYEWDEVHAEAETLEHAVSNMFLERIDALLGHPTRDPHGDPIPAADGTIEVPEVVSLAAVTPGRTIRVEQVSDTDPDMLRWFADRGIVVDTELEVVAAEPYSEALVVRVVGESSTTILGAAACRSLRVSPTAGAASSPNERRRTADT